MGPICCVPFCPTKSRTPGTTLHEIPVQPEMRQNWLRVISRAEDHNPNKSWVPQDRSSVCSRHFLEIDYIPHHKYRKLKGDAVPSVFPEYPRHKLPSTPSNRKPPVRRKLAIPGTTRKVMKSFGNIIVPPPPTIEATSPSPMDIENHIACTSKENEKNPISNLTTRRLPAIINKLRCAVNRKNRVILNLRRRLLTESPKPDPLQTSVEKVKVDAFKGETKALLLLQQLEAYGKNRHGWSEFCIRMCTLWRSKSPRAYNYARKQFVNLPCKSTLQSYIGPSSLDTGLTDLARLRLSEELRNLTEMDKMCSLIFDEMSISPQLQYRKQADRVVGMAQFGRGSKKSPNAGGLANRILCFVLKGLATNYRIPVAYYLTRQLQGVDLSKLILEVITQIELIGFRICRVVCDDATTNVKALEIICGGNLTHEIPHPARSEDPLFISFDQCHIVKNIRNQFLDDTRALSNNGKAISSKPLKILYESQKLLPIKPVRFLTRKTVYPTNFEKMNVKRAIQVFSTEVIAALEFCSFKGMAGFRDIDTTLQFMKHIQKWFTIHNVCNTTHYIFSRNDNSKHFGMIDDERLEWLERDFLGYLSSWRESTLNHQSTGNKTKMFLTRETYAAMRITTLSTVACIRYLIASGFHFVLSRKFSSDDIEGIFSAVRASQGYNDQANAVGTIYALETILKTGLFSSSIYGNCNVSHTEKLEMAFRTTQKNISGRVLPPGHFIELNEMQRRLASKFSNPPAISNVTTKTAGIAMVAGFALRLLKDKHSCPAAGASMLGTPDDSVNKLVSLQDRGGLMYPSRVFVCFVKLIFDILSLSNNHIHSEALVKSWVMTLLRLLPIGLMQCGCMDLIHTNQTREMVLGSLCKIYFNNICFNSTNAANEKPKYSATPLSRKIKKL